MNTWAIGVSLGMRWPPPATIIRCFGQMAPQPINRLLTNLQPLAPPPRLLARFALRHRSPQPLELRQVLKVVEVALFVGDEYRCLQVIPGDPPRCWFRWCARLGNIRQFRSWRRT